VTATAQPPRTAPAPSSPAPARPIWLRVFDLFASMKLTVVLLLFFGLLVWAGTLVQRNEGLYSVQRDFFESLYAIWDTGDQLWGGVHLKVPLPGGYLLMVVLFCNIIVGGVVRLRWRLRNAGILVVHLGIALLLVAGFVKLNFSWSGRVTLWEGDSTASMVSFHEFELVLVREDGGKVVERTVHERDLHGARSGTVTIDDAALPFTVAISHWCDNCEVRQKGPMFEVDVPVVKDPDGTGAYLQREDELPQREVNRAGCYVTVTERNGGAVHEGLLWGLTYRVTDGRMHPYTFEIDGKRWGLDLRRETIDLPFGVRLDRFQKTDHPGTSNPRDFSSWVTVRDAHGDLPVHIYMNHPLRRDGLVFFQTNWGPQKGEGMTGPPWYSTFEVASNPSDDWPKYASYVVLLGLLGHFLPKLVRYLMSSSRRAALPELS
jgi:hypothetical protein